MRILSVDDEASFTDMLKQYFEARGYEIDVASNGLAALDLIKKNLYDAILLDLKMPGMSGEAILAEMRKMGVNTRTIFITAYDSGKTRESLMEQGACAVIEKPISSLKMLESLVTGG